MQLQVEKFGIALELAWRSGSDALRTRLPIESASDMPPEVDISDTLLRRECGPTRDVTESDRPWKAFGPNRESRRVCCD